jgi:exopolysaccharide production protein ExoY
VEKLKIPGFGGSLIFGAGEVCMLREVGFSPFKLKTASVALLGPVGGRTKRVFDIVIASIALILVLPLFACAALMVKLTSEGPVFFRQERIGYRGLRFPCYKFRTMVVDADLRLRRLLDEDDLARREWQASQKLRCDPRVTQVGQILRLGSIDELPQLINVLLGDMSLVGPRPIVEDEIIRYREKFIEYRQARPGITGLWQVSGRNDICFEQRTDLDRMYVRNWSFVGDIIIMLKTIPAVLLSKGCY